ncbi:LuxR family transcriptional regulator [Trebonia sp.]|uniref:helix-turn-helix transcriptional regulator n=1 Tax=Trebonia sp. TaxID=2767075 RepID=UPI0026239885|nr:LuxR family transcriptional regulator [Trebonia sp.]
MDSRPIGRDAEIAQILAFLSAASGGPAALVITGDAGIGKTVVWQYALQAAAGQCTVLSCRPAPSERPLAFSALTDLFGEAVGDILPELAGPRRRAVEAALLRDGSLGPMRTAVPEADPATPEPRAVARGTLDVLRILAGAGPLMLAVDDAQWLDRPSAGVLQFCFRRLQGEPVRIAATCRTDDMVPLGLDRALPPDRLDRTRLGPLSLGAIGEILRSRLGAALPRYALTRLYDTCGGNPFYALECARMLLDHPHMSLTNEPLPLPPNIGTLLRRRVRRLTPQVRRLGWLVAASFDRRERLIRAACGDESLAAIDEAIDEGIIERDGEILRFTHPLLQSALYGEMPPYERRQVHQRLAMAAEDIEDRAWHMGLGADRPGADIAGMLEGAARHAASRGAPEEGATLAEQAARLTPAGQPEAARERMVQAADYHFRAGSMARSRELVQSALAACPPGPLRAALLLRLATVHYHLSGWPLAEQTFHLAAGEARNVPALRAHAEQELAFVRVVAGDLPGALSWAKVSLRSAEQAGSARMMAHSLARLAVFEFFQGHGARLDLLDKAEALDAAAGEEPSGRLPLFGPSLGRGLILKWCDRLDEARTILAGQYRNAADAGNEASVPFLLYHLSELECWAGKWDAAEGYALEARQVAEESGQQTMTPAALYCLALVRAHRGQVAQARDLATRALALCEQTGNVPLATQVLCVLGFIAVSLGDHQAAVSHLDRLAEATDAFGLGEPGVVKFLPDEIEALSALGHTDRAWSFTRQLEARGNSLRRPWALAAGARCRAHLAAASGDLRGAESACEQALSEHNQLPMPFELGRTLFVKGVIERRSRRKSAARDSFGQALDIFEHLGAALWADKTRREMSKIAVRAPVCGLTDTERRIAALVAQGHTNRHIAAAMFVTENTVQTHVQHIFRKLGLRSRTELAARMLSAPATKITDSRDSPARARN